MRSYLSKTLAPVGEEESMHEGNTGKLIANSMLGNPYGRVNLI